MNYEELVKAREIHFRFENFAKERYKEYSRQSDKGITWPDEIRIYLLEKDRIPYVLVDAEQHLHCGNERTGTRYSEIRIPFDKLEEIGYGYVIAKQEEEGK